MSIKKEGTIPVVLDNLDFPVNAIMGFTNAEFGLCCAAIAGSLTAPLCILSRLILGAAVYGFIAAVALGVGGAMLGAARAETLKKGRPSYLLWVDLKRKLQFQGVFGKRFYFGFIGSTQWDVMDDRTTTK